MGLFDIFVSAIGGTDSLGAAMPTYSLTTSNPPAAQIASATGQDTTPSTVIANSNNNLTIFQYPLEKIPYNLAFQFQKYSRTSAISGPTTNIQGQIYLPIPMNVLDYNHQKYEETQLGALGAITNQALNPTTSTTATGGLPSALAAGAFSSVLKLIPDALGAAALSAGKKSTVAGLAVVGAAAQAIGSQFSITEGISANPNLALFYVSPTFRKFDFVWKFSPRNANESNIIRQIISYFHQCMSPTLSWGGVFYGYPNIVIPQFLSNGANLDYLFRFKPCIITDCGVNYTPNGVPSFFAGTRAPTEIDFKITLTELSVWTSEDYVDEANINNV